MVVRAAAVTVVVPRGKVVVVVVVDSACSSPPAAISCRVVLGRNNPGVITLASLMDDARLFTRRNERRGLRVTANDVTRGFLPRAADLIIPTPDVGCSARFFFIRVRV